MLRVNWGYERIASIFQPTTLKLIATNDAAAYDDAAATNDNGAGTDYDVTDHDGDAAANDHAASNDTPCEHSRASQRYSFN